MERFRRVTCSFIGLACLCSPCQASGAPGPLPAYANNQCDDPIALVTAETTLPVNGAKHDWEPGTQNDWLGKCVTAEWEDWDGQVNRINVKVGSTLPNPGTCSGIAEKFNGGPRPPGWDFSGAGWCGLGSCPSITSNCSADVRDLVPLTFGRLACLAHDICVWSRCQQDLLRPNAMIAFSDNDSGELSWKEIQALFNHGEAEARLREREPVCGKAILQTASAYFDAENKRITEFEKSNQRPLWWNRRRWNSKPQSAEDVVTLAI